jgi:hypothetical protein
LESPTVDLVPQKRVAPWQLEDDEIDSVHARDLFWHQARKKLGKLRRLSRATSGRSRF